MAVNDNTIANETNKIEEINVTDSKAKVKAKRIYDPEAGKVCHQCRQRRKVIATCKMLKKDKLCPLTFCPNCLRNRYGENLEEVEKLENWACPKCRGVCNCSMCMKKKGYQPTGILAHAVKAEGFNSALELLHNKGQEFLEARKVDCPSSKRPRDKENEHVEDPNIIPIEEGLIIKEKKKRHKRIKCDNEENAGEAKAKQPRKVSKPKDLAVKAHKKRKEEIVLPLGSPLTEVAGFEMQALDAGAVLQFLGFCNAFSEVLDINKGQPERILRDLTRGRVKRHGVHSAVVEFNIKLLSLIKKGMKKDGDAWLHVLKRCIEESRCTLYDFPTNFFESGSSGYDSLEPSDKLKILIFLCDEVLNIKKVRNRIDEVAVKYDKERKENKEKVVTAKKKEKLLRQRVKDEMAKATLSITEETQSNWAELDDHLSQLKSEADTARAEVLASKKLVPKKNQRSDAVRTDHLGLGSNGKRLWKLSGYNNNLHVTLQDIRSPDSVTLQDMWFIFNEEEEKVVDKYISSSRNTKQVKHQSCEIEEGTESNSSDSLASKHGLHQVEMEA